MNKLEQLQKDIKNKKNLLIAFSGGVDSAVVAKIAYDTLGNKALAVTANSCTLSRKELRDAKELAKEVGIRYLIIKFSEFDNKEFVKNPENRCYYCRKELTYQLKKIARQEKIENIADGVNRDDFKEHRPGIKAADEENIWHPLAEANIGKDEIRKIAKRLGLTVHSKPSMACLASRIPYGEEITKRKLKGIEEAEGLLKSLGFARVRVRAHQNIARIEVGKNEIKKFLNARLRNKVIKKLKELGFIYVTLDLQGYRSGSMDEVL